MVAMWVQPRVGAKVRHLAGQMDGTWAELTALKLAAPRDGYLVARMGSKLAASWASHLAARMAVTTAWWRAALLVTHLVARKEQR